jgi:hypothetical protein
MNTEERKYQKARQRVAALRKFYIHLGEFVFVNLFLFLFDTMTTPDSLWFFWPLLGWGLAVVLHAWSVFGGGYPIGADWEEKKIQELMAKDGEN